MAEKTMKVLLAVLVKTEEAQLKISSHTPSVYQMKMVTIKVRATFGNSYCVILT